MDQNQNKLDGEMDYEALGLSHRAQETFKLEPPIEKYLEQCSHNVFDATTNPEGIIPFGLAENSVGVELLRPKLEAIAKIPDDRWTYFYSNHDGDERFRMALARFIEHNFHSGHKIQLDEMYVTNGATPTLEVYAFALAMPGEYIMVPRPFYFRMLYDFDERSGVNVLPVEQPSPTDHNERYPLDVPAMEKAYLEAAKEGKIVRAIHITNPNNPTGDMYIRKELEELLQFADRYKLHIICNELYSLTVFDPEREFVSILSIPHPDPTRVHYIWGMSKDFGLSGYRMAVTLTGNPGVAKYLNQVCFYMMTNNIGQARITKLLTDLDYFDNEFKPEMKKRMMARYKSVRDAVEECGGQVHYCPSTIFRWLDLRSFLPSPDWEGEHQLFLRLLQEGVFLVAGRFFDHMTPGYFRMVVAMAEDVHNTGMDRLVKILKRIRAEQNKL